MIEDMAQVHISEAEFARDVGAVLDRVKSGTEVVIERNSQPLAIIRSAAPERRTLSECIAIAEAREKERGGDSPVLDPDFVRDVQDFIDRHREPLRAPEWD